MPSLPPTPTSSAPKPAPGYYFAKEIIQFIAALAKVINSDERVNKKLKVVFVENYSVTWAELLTPAAEISEQISLAGAEASGTSNMKFMINGAVTLGTLDGANVEIHETVGEENIVLFGMTAAQAEELKHSGYNPQNQYHNDQLVRRAMDEMNAMNGGQFKDIFNALLREDRYMALADLRSYHEAQQRAMELYGNQKNWNRMSLINIARGRPLRFGPGHPGICREHLARFPDPPGEKPQRQKASKVKKPVLPGIRFLKAQSGPRLPNAGLTAALSFAGRMAKARIKHISHRKKAQRVMFNSRSRKYRDPLGAVEEGTPVHFRITLPRELSCSAAHLVIQREGSQNQVLDLFWCGMNGNNQEWWECHFIPQVSRPVFLRTLRSAPSGAASGSPKALPGTACVGGSKPVAADRVPKGLPNPRLAGRRRDVPDLPRPVLQIGARPRESPLRAAPSTTTGRTSRTGPPNAQGKITNTDFLRRGLKGH